MVLKQWANFLLCLIIACLIGYGIKQIADASDVVDLFNPEIQPSSDAKALADQVTLDSYRFELNQESKRIRAEFSMTNSSSQPVYNVVISCILKDKTGEKRGSGKWVLYETLAPLHSEHFIIEDKRYVSHLVRPDTIACKIVDVMTKSVAVKESKSGH
ncbi:MAG: hypothetical protein HKP41_20625 [Desulfobacterales bacterium]|nr:hypothetical protein [Desulfobacterales bacterium]